MTDRTLDILKECGVMAVAIYHIAVANEADGTPNVYAMLEEQTGLKTRQVQYLCKALVAHGFLAIEEGGGGRGHERRFTPLKGAQKGAMACTESRKGAVRCTDYPEKGAQKGAIKGAVTPLEPPVNVLSLEQSESTPPPPIVPRPRTEPTYPAAMLAFWDAFDPKGRERSSRKQVLAEWKKLRPDAELIEEIMAGLEPWLQSKSWREGFAPGAHRFLNLGKWRERPAKESNGWQELRNGRPSNGGTVQRGDGSRYRDGAYLEPKGRSP